MKPKGKRALNQKRKPEGGGSSHYSANAKSARAHTASQPLIQMKPLLLNQPMYQTRCLALQASQQLPQLLSTSIHLRTSFHHLSYQIPRD